MMLLDGQPSASVPADDRALAYGDGLFETIAIDAGRPLALERHLARLEHDSRRLRITPPARDAVYEDLARLTADCDRAVIKIIITRGRGGRGYRPPIGTPSRRILSRHPWPGLPGPDAPLVAWLCTHPLSSNPALAGIKHLNRLDQVLASADWPAEGGFEGFMCDTSGRLVEGTRSNLFLLIDGKLVTPDLQTCGVAGIVRAAILELSDELALECVVRSVEPRELAHAEEVFVTNSVIGLRSIAHISGSHGVDVPGSAVARRIAGVLAERGIIV